MNKEYKYKITVIIPIYNVEKYLEEAILSIINQTINIKNIELILVNDGSPDNSEKICLKYKDKYPNSVKYILKENAGVSAARNTGIDNAQGKYILFLDADDKMKKNSLKSLYSFFEKHYDDINFVISRVCMFEKVNKWHYLDFRFKSGVKIADIDKNIDYCQYHSTGILIKSSILKSIKYDVNVKYGEDMKLMSTILFLNGKFGIQKKSVLYYRHRFDETSAVQTQKYNKSYYINTMRDTFKYIFDECSKVYKYIPKYFQYYILNSLRERLTNELPIDEILSEKEKSEYIKLFEDLLQNIDDDIIYMQKSLNVNYKKYILLLKHGPKYKIDAQIKNNELYLNNNSVVYTQNSFLNVSSVSVRNNKIVFNIMYNDYILNSKLKIMSENKEIEYKPYKDEEISPEHIFNTIENKTLFVPNFYEFETDFNSKIEFCCKDFILPYNASKVLKHVSLYKKYLVLNGKMIIFNKNKIICTNKIVKLRNIFYLMINALFVFKRDGFAMVLRKLKRGIDNE